LIDLNPGLFERTVLLKGYLFKHIGSDLMPHFHNPNGNTGQWLYISELDKIIKPNTKFMIVPKRLWLGFYFDKDLELFDNYAIKDRISKEIQRVGKGILLAELVEGKNQIKTKYMVVPDHWPKLIYQ
jgi:hypothetical protein